MFNSKSEKAVEFICDEEIRKTLEYGNENRNNVCLVDEILAKAETLKGLDYR